MNAMNSVLFVFHLPETLDGMKTDIGKSINESCTYAQRLQDVDTNAIEGHSSKGDLEEVGLTEKKGCKEIT